MGFGLVSMEASQLTALHSELIPSKSAFRQVRLKFPKPPFLVNFAIESTKTQCLLWWRGLSGRGMVRWNGARLVCCRGGDLNGCTLAVFWIVIVLSHPLLEHVCGFSRQVAISGDINEILHHYLQPARVVPFFPNCGWRITSSCPVFFHLAGNVSKPDEVCNFVSHSN